MRLPVKRGWNWGQSLLHGLVKRRLESSRINGYGGTYLWPLSPWRVNLTAILPFFCNTTAILPSLYKNVHLRGRD